MTDGFKKIVLADLGLMRYLSTGFASTKCGTFIYMAPGTCFSIITRIDILVASFYDLRGY